MSKLLFYTIFSALLLVLVNTNKNTGNKPEIGGQKLKELKDGLKKILSENNSNESGMNDNQKIKDLQALLKKFTGDTVPGEQPDGPGSNPGEQASEHTGSTESTPVKHTAGPGSNPGEQTNSPESNQGEQPGGAESNQGEHPGGAESNPGEQPGDVGRNPNNQIDDTIPNPAFNRFKENGDGFDSKNGSTSNYFPIFFLVSISSVFLFYFIYHNRRRITAIILEGRQSLGRRDRPSNRKYRKIDDLSAEERMADLKTTPTTVFVY